MRIAILGSQGQLGAALVRECAAGHDVVALTRADLDLTDDLAVASAIPRIAPDAVINCAAYNDVDGAEDHPVEALNLNAFGVRALARAAAEQHAALVHFSTDFVFDGTASAPYTEEDRPSPRSVYATSKLLGEWFALDAPRGYVVRVETLFGRAPGRPAKGTVASMIQAMHAGDEINVFEDRTVTPTYVVDAAGATRQLIERSAPPGIYHCVNSGSCTWLEFAKELARQLGVDARLRPMRLDEAKLRAARPLFCALSNAKLAAAGIPMPPWHDALARHLAFEES